VAGRIEVHLSYPEGRAGSVLVGVDLLHEERTGLLLRGELAVYEKEWIYSTKRGQACC